MKDPLHTLQEGEVFVVATLAESRLVDLEVLSRPPTFHLREDQVALVANVDGGDSAEFLTIGDRWPTAPTPSAWTPATRRDSTSWRRWPRTSWSPSAWMPPRG
jgi:hypothetical protein